MGGRGASGNTAAGGASAVNPISINLTSGTTGQRFSNRSNLESAVENSGFNVFDTSGTLTDGKIYAANISENLSVQISFRKQGDDIEVTSIRKEN